MESYKQFIKRKDQEFKKLKPIPMQDISRQGIHYFIREAWTFMEQRSLPDKVFVIERLRRCKIEGEISYPDREKIGDIEYRIGYFIIGKNGHFKDKWVWGQFCPLIPQADFNRLFNKAQKEGTIK